jgi:hypothetical protein
MTRARAIFNPFKVWHYNGVSKISERLLFNEMDVMDYVRRKCPPEQSKRGIEEIPVSLSEAKLVCGRQVFRITPALEVRDEFLVDKSNLKFRTLKVLDMGRIVGWVTVASMRIGSIDHPELKVQFSYCSAKADTFNRKKGQFYAYLKLQTAPIYLNIEKGLYERIKALAVRSAHSDNVYWMNDITAGMLV